MTTIVSRLPLQQLRKELSRIIRELPQERPLRVVPTDFPKHGKYVYADNRLVSVR